MTVCVGVLHRYLWVKCYSLQRTQQMGDEANNEIDIFSSYFEIFRLLISSRWTLTDRWMLPTARQPGTNLFP